MHSKRRLLLILALAIGTFTLLCMWSYILRLEKFYWAESKSKIVKLSDLRWTKINSHFNFVEPMSSAVKQRGELHVRSNPFDENLVVIYNRVPKTGSTSFTNLAYDLCKKNHFYVLHINITANMHVLSLSNQVKIIWTNESFDGRLFLIHPLFCFIQMQFVRNITEWKDIKPALYHGHMAYLDFSKWVTRPHTGVTILKLESILFLDHQILDATETTLHKSHTKAIGSSRFVLLFFAKRRQLSTEFGASQSRW